MTGELRDASSSISVTGGAPDPTFGDVLGEKSQWQLSLDQLETRFSADLDSMTRSGLFFDYAVKRSQYVDV